MYKLEIHTCTWADNEDGFYETTCGHAFVFNDGTARENGFVWCPYCGGKMRQKRNMVYVRSAAKDRARTSPNKRKVASR